MSELTELLLQRLMYHLQFAEQFLLTLLLVEYFHVLALVYVSLALCMVLSGLCENQEYQHHHWETWLVAAGVGVVVVAVAAPVLFPSFSVLVAHHHFHKLPPAVLVVLVPDEASSIAVAEMV
jgi:hypothetical protein